MAGVKCAKCGELMQGKVKANAVIECLSCKKQFRVTDELITAYEQEREKGFIDYLRAYGIYGLGVLVALLIAYIFIFGEKQPLPSNGYEPPAGEVFFSSWDGSNRDLVAVVKAGMHNPDSFEHVETRYHDNGDSFSILMTFRGTNAMGATVTQQVTADLDKQTRQISNLKAIK
ncbi:hypothetical protein [Psychrobacter sp. I-STPA10]|uniref:hypothetical protein n=1 Tax=Psychrobacter sp. I-STPA10 TaxID=2585769 RepID=UPI001E44E5B1|nr:hypothetical protein [Psychrobacter sp. I-STPA10]